MYAVMRSGGKQYRVSRDDVITVERLPGNPGSLVEFEEILMIGDGKATTLGAPLLEGAVVTATILEQARADKVLVFKKKRRQGYRRLYGHRQAETVLRIDEVLLPGAARTPRSKKAASEPVVVLEKKKIKVEPPKVILQPTAKKTTPKKKKTTPKKTTPKKTTPKKTTPKKTTPKKKKTTPKKTTPKKKT